MKDDAVELEVDSERRNIFLVERMRSCVDNVEG